MTPNAHRAPRGRDAAAVYLKKVVNAWQWSPRTPTANSSQVLCRRTAASLAGEVRQLTYAHSQSDDDHDAHVCEWATWQWVQTDVPLLNADPPDAIPEHLIVEELVRVLKQATGDDYRLDTALYVTRVHQVPSDESDSISIAPSPPDDSPDAAAPDEVIPEDKLKAKLELFAAYMPMHTYIYIPTREMWPGSSVNARIPPIRLFNKDGTPRLDAKGNQRSLAANAFLDRYYAVEQMTWAPGLPLLIRDRLVADGGWIERKKVTCFNLYRPPTIILGDPNDVQPWLNHIHKVYPSDAEHIIQWLAHRRQRPQEKINHGLLLGGAPGIGKDSLLEPVKRAGPWNFAEVTPGVIMGRFNGYLKSVILRINEVRDLGDLDRYSFYEHTKPLLAAPPDVHRVDEKNLREHYVFNVCGVIFTTNYKTNGLYLPADDRRYYVAWSDLTEKDFEAGYWTALWGWYDSGGDRNVAAYLQNLNIESFNPKAPPKKLKRFGQLWIRIVRQKKASLMMCLMS